MNCKSCFSTFFIVVLVVAHHCNTSAASMKDLGTVGAIYPVVEEDVVAELKNEAIRHMALEKPGQLLSKMKKYQPSNLHTLPQAKNEKSFLVSMDYTIDHDIIDGEGNIIYPKGFTFNPLDYFTFPGGLVVIDGADPKHIKWFKNTPYAENNQARLLLSDGNAFDLTNELNRSVFYLTDDIAKRLNLAAVPSIIVQKGASLEVHEFKVDPDRGNGNNDSQ